MVYALRSAATALLVAKVVLLVCVQGTYGSSLPIVDLGYQLQQATIYNSTGNFYNFSNIRYAAPPTGENRFRAPQPPAVNRSVVQTGEPDVICPQVVPGWLKISKEYIPLYLAGQTNFTFDEFNTSNAGAKSRLPPQDPRTTEDCLFLDVLVPKDIFDNAGKGYSAPVLVWIYGGGYTYGSKSDSGNPAGLLARSEAKNSPGVIYVSMNYRLGAFGWLSGPTFQSNGTANAGLYDQRFALQWVQQYISLFGGDPTRVTILGQSAGGASVMHQITAYGGNNGGNNGPLPFAQAILQSPGFQPIVSNQQQEQIFNDYLSLLNITTIEQARRMPFSALQIANTLQISMSNFGRFTYGPTVDGNFVPALPGELLLHGRFPRNLRIMVGHNADEGLLFTSPFIQNGTAFDEVVADLAPAALPQVLSYITDTLYPPIFDGSQAMGYTNQIGRAAALTSEVIFTCNTFYLDKAYGNDTFSYYFTIPPALHGEDIPYTYYNGPNPKVRSIPIAEVLQSYITSFVETGSPNGQLGVPYFVRYGDNATVQDLKITGVTERIDPTANYRCDWWQKALYV